MRDEERTGQGGTEGGGGTRRVEGHAGARGADASAEERVLTIVCFKCGMEYHFTDSVPDGGISC